MISKSPKTDPDPDPIPKQEDAPPGGCPDSPIDIDNVEM